jgi:hypothetical protein
MTPDQIRLFMEWVEAQIAVAIEDHARRHSGQERLAAHDARHAVYEAFGFNEDGSPIEPEHKEGPRLWRPHPHPSKAWLFVVQDKDGNFHMVEKHGAMCVWTASQESAAKRKAKELNSHDL